MGRCLAHRGPDDDGLYSHTDDRVSVNLAHRRLSIIDLSGGHQPLVKGPLALCYNGEMYNYRRDPGRAEGTGIHLHDILRYRSGAGSLAAVRARTASGRFRGMFAFALFDRDSGSLYLARDQLGIKPLHYLVREDGVVFASELKALVAAYGSQLRMDAAVSGRLRAALVGADQRCSILGVEKLQPGTWAEFRPDGTYQVGCYWDVARVAANAAAGPAMDLGEAIEQSVTAHLVADVPVSSFLSGGLDSSIITVLAKRANPDLDAYTITFRPEDHRLEAMPDDGLYARKVAGRYGIRLHEIQIAPDIVEILPKIVGILDEPIGDPAAINTLLMCEAAATPGSR